MQAETPNNRRLDPRKEIEMKFTKFKILFATDIQVEVFALSKDEAVILAQAEQIQAGNMWRKILRVEAYLGGVWSVI
jgi:hypothetical protein